jgi:hypothetical protein
MQRSTKLLQYLIVNIGSYLGKQLTNDTFAMSFFTTDQRQKKEGYSYREDLIIETS